LNGAYSIGQWVGGVFNSWDGKLIRTQKIQSQNVASDWSNNFDNYNGVWNSTNNGTEPNTWLYFRYQFSTDGNFRSAVSANGWVRTTTLVNAFTINTSYIFKIVVNRQNTLARFYINWVLVATHATNLPAAGIDLWPRMSIRKSLNGSAGTSNFNSDYVAIQFYMNNQR
jgi:hypothetical protein